VTDDIFRLPVSSYDELTKIIRAYSATGSDSSLDDVANTAAMNRTTVSANNGFLKGIGVIEGGNKKSITDRGKRLALALDHEMEDEICDSWREIAQENDFLQKILAAVRIRGGMDHDTLQSHIAYTAGQAKAQRTVTGTTAIINILQASKLLLEQDGKLVAARESALKPMEAASPVDPLIKEQSEGMHKPIVGVQAKTASQHGFVIPVGATQVGVKLQIQIQCGVGEMDELRDKLPELIRALSNAGATAVQESSSED
jgi:hypothetical protein